MLQLIPGWEGEAVRLSGDGQGFPGHVEGDHNLLAAAELPQSLQNTPRCDWLAAHPTWLLLFHSSGLCVPSPRPGSAPCYHKIKIIKIHIFCTRQLLHLGWHQPRARPSQGNSNLDKPFPVSKMSQPFSGHASFARGLLCFLFQCPPELFWESLKGTEWHLKAGWTVLFPTGTPWFWHQGWHCLGYNQTWGTGTTTWPTSNKNQSYQGQGAAFNSQKRCGWWKPSSALKTSLNTKKTF